MQITASALGPVSRMTAEEVAEAIRESWIPSSIKKRWEYYAAKEPQRHAGTQQGATR